MNLQLSKKESHRAVAPIIATLILVAIAVVGGVMIFVFAQDFFGGESMTGPGTIDQISMSGYDFRDVAVGTFIKDHEGVDIEFVSAVAAGTTGNFAEGDGGAIFIRNAGTTDVSVTRVTVTDKEMTFLGTALSATNLLVKGSYVMYADDLAGTRQQLTSANIPAGETATVAFGNDVLTKNGRTVAVDVTTGSGQKFTFSVVVGQDT